jgi:hypothetical protein
VKLRTLKATVGGFFLTASGANRDVLVEAPKERTKQIAMGAVLASTAAIAVVSASYALHLALHVWLPFAALGGLAWGLVILNLDRWLVVSTPRLKTKLGTLAMALPRVLLAVLIGAVISTPLTLAVFSAEINTEVKVMAAEEDDAFNTQLDEDSRYRQIPDWEKQVNVLQADIAQGVTDADVLHDPAVEDLQRRIDEAKARYEAAATAFQCENDGTCGTGVAGIGDVSREKEADRDRLEREWHDLQAQLGPLKDQVRQQLEAEQVQKTADQKVHLAAVQKQLAGATSARQTEIDAHQEAVGNGDGILARLTALNRLADRDSLINTAHWLLFAFMTALECLPIIFKTMLALAPPNLYERLLALEEERAEARVRLRMQTEYEEAETMARSALVAAEARAARTLEAESKATGLVLGAQLAVTREGVRRWREEQIERMSGGDGDIVAPPDLEDLLDDLDGVPAPSAFADDPFAGRSRS